MSSEPEVLEWTLASISDDSPVHAAVTELKAYLKDWEANSRDSFWQRKSGQPVISVVICKDRTTGKFKAYRGMNTEVSLPAGSLCAERAAIAQTAADFRPAADILAVATADPSDRLNPLWPCEVCQSWLAKLRLQSPEISVIAVSSVACNSFHIRVNGEVRLPPQPLPPLSPPSLMGDSPWPDLVVLAEGTLEFPWESETVIYVDGGWTFLHAAQQQILRVARARGSHLLVGVHSDETLLEEFGTPTHESFEERCGRVLQNRFVSSVLKKAPWAVTHDLVNSLGIQRVLVGSVCKSRDGGKGKADVRVDPYAVPRDLGILEVVPSLDEITERSIFEAHVLRAAQRE